MRRATSLGADRDGRDTDGFRAAQRDTGGLERSEADGVSIWQSGFTEEARGVRTPTRSRGSIGSTESGPTTRAQRARSVQPARRASTPGGTGDFAAAGPARFRRLGRYGLSATPREIDCKSHFGCDENARIAQLLKKNSSSTMNQSRSEIAEPNLRFAHSAKHFHHSEKAGLCCRERREQVQS